MRPSFSRSLRACLVAVSCLLAAPHGASFAAGQALDEGVDMPKHFVSLEAHPVLEAARQLLIKDQYAAVLEKLRELDGVSGKNGYDEYVAMRMTAAAHTGLKDTAAAEPLLVRLLASTYVVPEEKLGYRATLAHTRALRGDFAGVVPLMWNHPGIDTDPDMAYTLAYAYGKTGRQAEAGKLLMQMLQILDKQNKVPQENDLKLMAYYCQESKNQVCITEALERQMRHYPSSELREQLVQRLAGTGMPAEVRLEAMRLQFATKRLRPSQHADFVRLLIQHGSPAEAAKVMAAGVPGVAPTVPDAQQKTFNEKVAGQIKAARESGKASGYDKLFSESPAVAMDAILTEMSAALPADLPILTLHLALAQQAAGERTAAAETFKSVKGYPSVEKLARLWLDHFNTKDATQTPPAKSAKKAK